MEISKGLLVWTARQRIVFGFFTKAGPEIRSLQTSDGSSDALSMSRLQGEANV